MKKKMIEFELDTEALPPLSKAQQAEIRALKAKPDKKIDFTDIPALDTRFWERAVRGNLYKPVKTSTTVRVDADVLLWLKSKGKGYQTRINAILRQAMLDEAGIARRRG